MSKSCTSEPRYYAVLDPDVLAVETVILPALNSAQTDSIKWAVYFNFFQDTLFHKSGSGFTTIGELRLEVPRTIKILESSYQELSFDLQENLLKECVGCALQWSSRDSLIGVKWKSKIVTGVLFDTSCSQVIKYSYRPAHSTGSPTGRTFTDSKDKYDLLSHYLKTKKDIDPWFRKEAIRRGYLVE